MTPERLAEIREVANGTDIEDPARLTECRNALRELLDHIAQLEAQQVGAVVVAELTDAIREQFLGQKPILRDDSPDGSHLARTIASNWSARFDSGWNACLKFIQPIPASQVLQPGEAAVKWISVSDQLPEDGETVGFITECSNDRWYHGRVLGGRYRAGEFGGFSVPGLTVQASHWFRFPAIPDALLSQAGGA